jgi:hypothetical protein
MIGSRSRGRMRQKEKEMDKEHTSLNGIRAASLYGDDNPTTV